MSPASKLTTLSTSERAAFRRKMLMDLQKKAEEYLAAMCLEVGLAVDQEEARNLQMALRQDFIEVHNEAMKDPVLSIPEDKAEIDKLMAETAKT